MEVIRVECILGFDHKHRLIKRRDSAQSLFAERDCEICGVSLHLVESGLLLPLCPIKEADPEQADRCEADKHDRDRQPRVWGSQNHLVMATKWLLHSPNGGKSLDKEGEYGNGQFGTTEYRQ